MSNIASGGFSSKNESIGYWNNMPFVQYIIIIFMFLAGTNFILIYFGLTGKIKKIIQNNDQHALSTVLTTAKHVHTSITSFTP